jgi:hypothetical protein
MCLHLFLSNGQPSVSNDKSGGGDDSGVVIMVI